MLDSQLEDQTIPKSDDAHYDESFIMEEDKPTALEFFRKQAARKFQIRKSARREQMDEAEEHKSKILGRLKEYVEFVGLDDDATPNDLRIRSRGVNAAFGNNGTGIGTPPTLDTRMVMTYPSIEADQKRPLSESLEPRSRLTRHFRTPALYINGEPPRQLTSKSLLLRMSGAMELNALESDSETSAFDSDDERDWVMRKVFSSSDFDQPSRDALNLLRKESINRGEKFSTAGRIYEVPDDIEPLFDHSLRLTPTAVWASQKPDMIGSKNLPHHHQRERPVEHVYPLPFMPRQMTYKDHAMLHDLMRMRIVKTTEAYYGYH